MVYERPVFDVEYIKPDLEKRISSEVQKAPVVADFSLAATAVVAGGTWIVAVCQAKGAYRRIDWRDIDTTRGER